MIKKSISELKFVVSRNPIPTVEVDMDSLPDDYCGYGDILTRTLQSIARKSPKMVGTIYVYQGPSINFMRQTHSAFIGIAGPDRLLQPLLKSFEGISGVKARFSDYIDPRSGVCEFHLQDGELWQPLDADTWYSENSDSIVIGEKNIKENDRGELDDENEANELAGTQGIECLVPRISNPTRFRIARSDASIGSIKQKIEEIFGLPAGSVALCGPDKKSLRSDATIATLKKRWE